LDKQTNASVQIDMDSYQQTTQEAIDHLSESFEETTANFSVGDLC